MTKEIKEVINEKKRAFFEGDKDKIKSVQKKLIKVIEEGKDKYRQKLKNSFESGNSRDAWSGMKQIAGMSRTATHLPDFDDGSAYATELNEFYSRFDQEATPDINSKFRNDNLLDFPDDIIVPVFEEEETSSLFKRLKLNKAFGPDKISNTVLKLCPSQLAVPYTFLFNWSFKEHKLPSIWKTSEIVPTPKKPKITALNDLRPVALTSVVVKCFERLVLSRLLPAVCPHQDPNQFAYKSKRSVDDAIALFFDNIYKHLDKSGNFCRVLFLDFSSAFNFLQPKILVEKLLELNVNVHICSWIFDFLTERPQFVRLKIKNDVFCSSTTVLNVGSPQGTVLSPALYSIYTDNCRSSCENIKIIKFADDTAIQGLLSNSVSSYFNEIDMFVKWCKEHSLHLNVSKTKEIVIDFRKSQHVHPNVIIDGETVEQVENYKYLGVHVNNKLDWTVHTSSVISKINQRMFFVRKLNYFKVDKTLISLFYQSVIQSIISFCICIWGGNANSKAISKIDSVAKYASKITCSDQLLFDQILSKFTEKKIIKIMKDQTHPLNEFIQFSSRSNRLIIMKTRTERYKRSFLPRAIKDLYIKKFKRI